MAYHPECAFILAAGMGSRLRPYTDERPKPLVEVCGQPLIDTALDKLAAAGVCETTINLHYKADMLEEHLRRRAAPHLSFSREDVLLDTGGGVKKALATMKDKPFYLLSGDTLWVDGFTPALHRLAEEWDDGKMDLLLLLYPVAEMTLTRGAGDYHLKSSGHAERALDKSGAYMFTSIRICSPRLFENTPDNEPFSFLRLMDKAEAEGRLFGIVHDGLWHHISTAEDLERVNQSCHVLKKSA